MKDIMAGLTISKYAMRIRCTKTHMVLNDELNVIGEILEGINGLLLGTGIKYPAEEKYFIKNNWNSKGPEASGFIIWDKDILQIDYHIPPGPKGSRKHSWTPASLYEKTGEKDGGAFCSNCQFPATMSFYGIHCLNKCGEEA